MWTSFNGSPGGTVKKNEIIFNKELGEKLHKLVIRKF